MLSGHRAVVHLVDDDAAVRDSLKLLLESHGGTVYEYSSALEFLDVVDAQPEGCLLLDLHLPIMSGLDLIGIMRQRNMMLPVVVITGRREDETRARAMRAGVVAFLEKPVREEILIPVIRRALAAQSARASRRDKFTDVPEFPFLVPS